MIFAQKAEGCKGLSHEGIGGKNIADQGNSQCKGPEAVACLLSSQNGFRSGWLEQRTRKKSRRGQRGYVRDGRAAQSAGLIESIIRILTFK